MRLLLCFLLLTAGTAAFATDLVGPLRSGNQTKLERLGEREGAAGLAFELVSKDRLRTLAALHAAHGATDSWALLGMLADKGGDPDRSIAIVAARVAVEIAHDLDGFAIELNEIPNEDLLHWHRAWLKVARQARRWVDIRIYALESAETLRRVIPRSKQPVMPWQEFFADRDPEMRAAAIALAPRNKELEVDALALLTKDESPSVAISAAQWLCGPLGSKGPATTLDAAVATRLRELASNPHIAIAARADLANCLIAEASVESRRSVALLLQQSPPALRRALLALTQPSSAP
jgi:hypothetical protein